ncbi:MAG: hypothetical protein R3D89_00815 [Sphingomonadaceae bacterium]|jgi:hypothetical protein
MARLRNFHGDCVSSATEEQAERIREAAQVLSRGHRFHRACPLSYNFHALEAMLAFGAFESAALTLVGDDFGFTLSRGSDGACLATVLLSDGCEEAMAEASSPALALLAAHAGALIAECEQDVGLPQQRVSLGGAA